MKTYLSLKKPLLKLCESYWQSFLFLSGQVLQLPVPTQLRISTMRVALLNFRGTLVVFLTHLKVVLGELVTNKRFLVGGLISMVGFASWRAYLLFDESVRSEVWYYQNWAAYLFTVRQEIGSIFFAIGFFIALPAKVGFRWLALPAVFFYASEICLQYGYDDYMDFRQDMPSWQLVTFWLLVTPAVLLSMNYLLYRKYHLKDGNYARIIGMIELDMPWADKEKTLKLLAKEFRDFNSRV
jgi:hypothetical protein